MRAAFLTLTLVATTATATVAASALSAQELKPRTGPAPSTTLRTGTQLVVVDVVVQDAAGHPVHGLKSSDFLLNEDKKLQTIRNFEEHTNAVPVPRPSLPPLPPGTFTDYTPVPASGPLNILLLDALNTPMKDQSYVRYELQQYVKHAAPGTNIAIFGLAQRLYILQGFSSDPQALKDAVDHKLIPRASPLLDDQVGSGAGPVAAANLSDFEAEAAAMQTQLRLQYTMDAFDVLAHYLANFPGRKNLIWFSGSFPIDILPDPSLQNPNAVTQINDEEFRETSSLLAKSQVAVYPVDARGLMTDPTFNASSAQRGMTGQALSKKTAAFAESQFNEHSTMDEMADDTGGVAFYNNNDLSKAVSQAIEAGSNYYTLSYTPSNKAQDGGYREIRVTLTGGKIYKLAYRHGYYSDDPAHPLKGAADAPVITEATLKNGNTGEAYARASMARAAPTPEDILFKVRVLPATTGTENSLAEGNQPDPKQPMKGPFRRYLVDFAAVASDFKLTVDPSSGRHTGQIEFTALLYDPEGKLLNASGNTVNLNLDDATYKHFLSGVGMHLEISAPAKGDNYLRIAVHDIPSNKFGVVEIPTTDVAKLTPPPPPPPPPPAATVPPAAATPPAGPTPPK